MKKKILFLEDNGYLVNQTRRFLKEDGYEVISFTRIDLAIDYLKDNNNSVDCIITDLNMEDEWLGEYQGESYGGLLSGWVWLMRFVYVKEELQNIPCIIYSGYIVDLENYLRRRQEYYLLNKYDITCIQKGGNNDNGYKALEKKLNEIFAQI